MTRSDCSVKTCQERLKKNTNIPRRLPHDHVTVGREPSEIPQQRKRTPSTVTGRGLARLLPDIIITKTKKSPDAEQALAARAARCYVLLFRESPRVT